MNTKHVPPQHWAIPALDWLRQLLAWQIAVTRQTYGPLAEDPYRGLYVPVAEVDLFAATAADLPADLVAARAALDAARPALAATPLAALAQRFGLRAFERDVLLVALAPELDLRFERVYAFIQDDVSRRRPSVDLALRLLCATPAARLAHQRCFEGAAPLVRHQLLTLFDDGQRRPALLARSLKLDDRIIAALRDEDPAVDPQITAFAALLAPQRALATQIVPPAICAQVRRALAEPVLVGIAGGYGSGRQALIEAVCAETQRALLCIDVPRLVAQDLATTTTPPAEIAARLVREAALRDAVLLFQGAGAAFAEPGNDLWRRALLDALATHSGPAFLALDAGEELRSARPGLAYQHIELPALSYSGREQIWQQRLNGASPGPVALAALASTFRLSGGQIRDAVAHARVAASWRGDAPPTPEDLAAACRAQSRGALETLARKVPSNYTWIDLVLPADQTRQLREICLQVRHRRTVLETWGFEQRLAMGKGVNVLFAGPSGTGKTMAAEIIAADLGLELYKIDLSSMVSKYIGETEKNLDRVFTAAREANAILFFDEADAIFGKRSEVKDAHDRYANIEVGYLLQQMERYDGVVILATNLRKNMDDAFIRRLHVAVEFPFPEEADRLLIWRKVFPAQAPLAGDVDLAFVAKQFKLTGGNIRNIALLAAYLAADEGDTITMRHVMRALKREYQKLGKLVTAAEFGIYFDLTRAEPAR